MRSFSRSALVLLAAIAAGVASSASTAVAGGIPYPDEFLGIWEITSITRDCVTQVIISQGTEQDTICAGDTYDPDNGGQFPVTCTGTITATTVDIQCTGQFEVFPGCNLDYLLDVDGTRNGDTMNATTTITNTYSAGCGPIEDTCIAIQSTGTRIAPPPSPCRPSPVEPVSWGRIKNTYN